MQHKKLLSLSISIALGLTSSLALSTAAVAQDEQLDAGEAVLEEVLVTGSRIPRLDPQMVTPVQVYDAEFIENTGAFTMQDFLFQASFAGPGLFNENQTLSQTAGTANFDSRGFGDDYVVILLNGRRLPGDPVFGDGATNLNLIPISAVERVEYLSTGASAIYGADAVQGVINIITRQEWEGLQIKAQYGNDEDSGGARYGFSLAGGVSGESGWTSVSFEYLKQKGVSAAGLPLVGSAIAPDGTDGRSPTGAVPDYMTFVDFGPDNTSYPAAGCPEENKQPAFYTAGGQNCMYDFAPLYEAVPEMERMNFLVNAEYNLSENWTGYGEFRYSRNVTQVANGASPAFFNITGAPQLADIDAQLGSDMANSSSVYLLRRAVDAGPRASENTNTAFSVVLGARTEIGDGHLLDLSLTNIESEMNFVGTGGNLSRSRLSAAVADGTFDPLQVYDVQWFINEGIAVTTQRQGTGTDTRFDAQLTGEIGDTGIGYAVGGQYKEDDFVDVSDAVQIDADVAGGAGSAGRGEREVFAVFGELAYNPIDSVELSLAGRYDDYTWKGLDSATGIDGVGSSDSAGTYMFGASWRPLDNLMLRASYGTGFKAPTLGELYLGGSFGVQSLVDTTYCNQVTNSGGTAEEIANACRVREIRSVSGGNVNLETESSKNYSIGMVWEPMDNWSIALDYYNIQVEDIIGALGVQEILNNEDQYPELVNRVNGQLSDPNAYVEANLQNLNQENGEGIDLSTMHRAAFNSGSFVTDLRVAWLLAHERQTSAIQPLCEDKGTTSEPEWRVNGQFGWQSDADWSLTMTARYLDSTVDYIGGRANNSCEPQGRTRKVDSYLELGLRGTYTFGENLQLAAGIINLTSEEPAFSEIAAGGWPWFDQSLYDPRGMRYYLNLTYDF